ncbi:hypothetical protein [Phyllobacterium endophyticum]|jgi:hypothetical protein|uniref:Lipoprotein n=1 Tax=Phyllobacterium endophyticum TaxID=1149773 RepID=A0A2P7AP50_9HYPH|nr:hypothetical protein [Phyllobacterium endophyticum]MBB3233661.1 hypothetical protein [Phyllobacterium endophyticum]PSH55985.1 hypothetical protein CU100_20340 [Phyllobacterium endophyticum]TXR47343.1 hypothetical protein FVA77_20645 [Phyllobacterium endophyticum]TYR41130.1 hypothetical protein FY050_07350 [Phyllobacterium endophyticum]
MMLLNGRLWLLALGMVVLAGCAPNAQIKPNVVSYNNQGSGHVTATSRARTSTQALQQAGEGRYFIEFRSRYALTYGHSYVMFGRLNKAGQMIDKDVAGLHPASNSPVPYVLGHYIPVPAETGASDGDLEDRYKSASWRVMLNETEYRTVVAYIRKLQARSRFWQATVYNCNAFVGEIARSMGYKTPGHLMRPQQYITKLRQMNGGPNAIGYTGPAG